jgi:hypothetical protein
VAVVRDLTAGAGRRTAAGGGPGALRLLVAHEVRNPLSAVKIALQTLGGTGLTQSV